MTKESWLPTDEEINNISSGATTLRRLNSVNGKRMRDWKSVAKFTVKKIAERLHKRYSKQTDITDELDELLKEIEES